jgi:hypothetical protein
MLHLAVLASLFVASSASEELSLLRSRGASSEEIAEGFEDFQEGDEGALIDSDVDQQLSEPGQDAPAAIPALGQDAPADIPAPTDASGPDSGETLRAGCGGIFGALDDKMTVVNIDAPGGCVPGQKGEGVFVHYAGGPHATCQPPPADEGCYRYVLTRYRSGCDLSSLQGAQSLLGKRVPFTMQGDVKFDEDGVFARCNRAPLVLTRTMRYIGTGVASCGKAYCEAVLLQNEARRTTSIWVLTLVTVLTAWSLC